MAFTDIYSYLGNAGSLLQLIVAITASFYFYKYKSTFLKYFLAILWFGVLIDAVAIYCIENFNYNAIVYNLYHLFNFTLLLLIYRAHVEKTKNKKLISYFIYIFLLVYIFNMFFQNYITQILTAPFIVGGIFVITSIILYFTEILYSDKLLNITRNLLFWISTGLLLYFIVKIPTRLLRNHWEETVNYKDIFTAEYIIAITMNLFFIIGFICSKEEKGML